MGHRFVVAFATTHRLWSLRDGLSKILQLNWLADTSAERMAQSLGMMVNYGYISNAQNSRNNDIAGSVDHAMEICDRNAEKYFADGSVAVSPQVSELLREMEGAFDDNGPAATKKSAHSE